MASLQGLTLTSGDFDGDGVDDLVSGFSLGGQGLLALQRGNIDSLFPNTPAANLRRQEGTFHDAPFFASPRLHYLNHPPDFLQAGDFNADGHLDVVTASLSAERLWFHEGDGYGRFSGPRSLLLPGTVTALLAADINPRDGLMDVIAGVTGPQAPALLVFGGPSGAVNAPAESYRVEAAVSAVAVGQLDEEYPVDLALAAGEDLLILYGRKSIHAQRPGSTSLDRYPMGEPIESLAIGDFLPGAAQEIAVFTSSGQLIWLQRATEEQDSGFRTAVQLPLGRRALSASDSTAPGRTRLVPTRISTSVTDDLLVLEGTVVQVISVPVTVRDESALEETIEALEVGKIVPSARAILPMRLNKDALSDLVVLGDGSEPLLTIETEPGQIFTVNLDTDQSDASVLDDICDVDLDTKEHECTIHAAVRQANWNAGLDEIRFTIGKITQGQFIAAITDPVTIDATTFEEIVELDGLGLFLSGGDSVIRGMEIHSTSSPILLSGGALGTGNNRVEGCSLGVIGTGVGGSGINIAGSDNVVGGSQIEARNTISGSFLGVTIQNGNLNKVLGNYIGTDVNGLVDVGNEVGVTILSATNTEIGGVGANEGNLISGNNSGGVFLNEAEGTLLQGNKIGTQLDGDSVLVNIGVSPVVSVTGISLFESDGNTIGGLVPNSGNVIAVQGTGLSVQLSDSNEIYRNRIGVDSTGTKALANGQAGIQIRGSGNRIGSGFSKDSNTIAFQEFDGIRISGNESIGNFIFNNSIFANGGLGINLSAAFFGITVNDELDEDEGPNGLQNFPVIERVDNISIAGTMHSSPKADFRLEFFQSEECDPSDHGEGKIFLGALGSVTTDGEGNAAFSTNFGTVSGFITATATELGDPGSGTSEFSACVEPQQAKTFVVNSTRDDGKPQPAPQDGECWTGEMIDVDGEDVKECTLRAAIEEANISPDFNRIHFNIPDPGEPDVHTIRPGSPETNPDLLDPGLPSIYHPVWIDGYSQPGTFRAEGQEPATLLIEIDGTGAGPEADGFIVERGAEGTRISGLVIHSFGRVGIQLLSNDNWVEGNHIGTDAAGMESKPNPGGVFIVDAARNMIGGIDIAFRNVIDAGDAKFALSVYILGPRAQLNEVKSNYIGTRADGRGFRGKEQARAGVLITNAPNNFVGEVGAGNLILIGGGTAIQIGDPNLPQAQGNRIVGNQIGLMDDEVRNTRGIFILEPGNRIEKNRIVNSFRPLPGPGVFNGAGIILVAKNNRVIGNTIESNDGVGVLIRGGADNEIGSLEQDDANTIRMNGRHVDFQGIQVLVLNGSNEDNAGSTATGNAILSNVIVSGHGPHTISLGPKEETLSRSQDRLDVDPGPNGFQNFPEIKAALRSSDSTRVRFELPTNPTKKYTVQLFAGPICGGGQFLLTKTDLEATTGKQEHVFELGPLEPGRFLTATATDPDGNTSEFSDCVEVQVDTEADGSSDQVEDTATPQGDGNQDGTADSQQGHVVTTVDEKRNPVTLAADSETTSVEVVETFSEVVTGPEQEGDAELVALTPMNRVKIVPDAGSAPRGPSTAAASVTLTVFYPPDLQPETYLNYGPTPDNPVDHAYEFLFDGETGAEILEDRTLLHFVDGQRGDHDLIVNGEIVTAGAPAASATRFYFAQIGDGQVSSIGLQTSGVLKNTSGITPVQLELFDSTGDFFDVQLDPLGQNSLFSFGLNPGESISLQSAGEEDIQAGYAEVLARTGVGGTAVFSRTDLDSGTLLYEAGVPASRPLRDFTVFADTTGNRETGLAIAYPLAQSQAASPQTADANLTLRLYDKTFQLLGTEELLLLPGHHQASFLTQIFSGVPGVSEMEGTVTVASDQNVVALTLRQNDAPGMDFPDEVPTLATFPVVPGRADMEPAGLSGDSDTLFYFPQIGDGTVAGIRLQTSLVLISPGQEVDVDIDFFNSAGDLLEISLGTLGSGSSFDIHLKRGEAVSLQTPGTSELVVGYARVTSTGPVGGTAIFSRSDAGSGVLLYEAGVPASEPMAAFSLVVDTLGDRNTGLALVVPPDAQPQGGGTITMRLYDQSFSLVAEGELNLAPGQHLPRFVDELFPDQEGVEEMEGSLSISSPVPVAAELPSEGV